MPLSGNFRREMLQALKNAKKDKQGQNTAEETTLQEANDSAVNPTSPATTVNANDHFNKNKEIGKRRNSSP
ncbi:hypothetical protein KGM_211895 [Danaus plexippus plexippus]|uniref:Uncharacterized protein n=1 Tax=Danaus plexippus plexippus TaxID=278856 RepID=A0A212FAG3_DANPL|nr:hypothetical protein KGM_211895 [Danaus plexippus plexippus]